MMKHFKLALFVILIIIGCVLAHANLDANEADSLVANEHEFAERAHRSTSGSTSGDVGSSSSGSPCSPPSGSSGSSSSSAPTEAPTDAPTDAPTRKPTPAPTSRPTSAPTSRPTPKPGHSTPAPTSRPTPKPTPRPTPKPSTTGKSSTSTTGHSSTSSSSGSTTGLCDIVPTSSEPLKLLVPLYVDPGSAWDNIAAGAATVETIAIINPNSGPDSSAGSSYTTYMNKLNNAGVILIGYVHTSYGDRSASDVQKDIDTYVAQYPGLQGIFFDEVSDSAQYLSYYTSLYNYVMAKSGYVHCILNPGTQPDEGYLNAATSIVIFEDKATSYPDSFSSWVTCASSSSEKSGYKYKFSAIAYSSSSSSSAATLIASMQNSGVGMVYVTDGASGCCTYNELVSYYSSEVSSLTSMNK